MNRLKRALSRLWLVIVIIISLINVSGLSEENDWIVYESPFNFTIQYPSRLFNVCYDTDDAYDEAAILFQCKDEESDIYMVCRLIDDPAYPFWTEDGWEKLDTDQAVLSKINVSMTYMSLGQYLEPGGKRIVEELRLEYPVELLDHPCPEIVFDFFYPADNQTYWRVVFESMIVTLNFPPLEYDIDGFHLGFYNRDALANANYTDIIVDKDAEPVVLSAYDDQEQFVLERVYWKENQVSNTETLYSTDVFVPENKLRIYCSLSDPLPILRIRWIDPWTDGCLYIVKGDRDGSLLLLADHQLFPDTDE